MQILQLTIPSNKATFISLSPIMYSVVYIENIFGVLATMGKITNSNTFMHDYNLFIS